MGSRPTPRAKRPLAGHRSRTPLRTSAWTRRPARAARRARRLLRHDRGHGTLVLSRGWTCPEGAADAGSRATAIVAPWLEKGQRGRAPLQVAAATRLGQSPADADYCCSTDAGASRTTAAHCGGATLAERATAPGRAAGSRWLPDCRADAALSRRAMRALVVAQPGRLTAHCREGRTQAKAALSEPQRVLALRCHS
jgi:hypothetical protein